MTPLNFLTLALSSSLVLDHAIQAHACRCMQRELCDVFEEATLVVHASPFVRSEQEDVNDPVTYAVSTIDLYKGDQITAQRLTITTAGSSAACGIYMELGEEYLIGVFQDETTGVLTANTCGLFRSWSDVTKEDVALLENGCGSDNGCDRACDEYQDCIFYEDESEYYCSDVCDPERCPEDEVCVLQHVQCLRAPCPPIAACLEDPCNGTCCETQTCIQDLETNNWLCSPE